MFVTDQRLPLSARIVPLWRKCFKHPNPVQRSVIGALIADMDAERRKVWPSWASKAGEL